MIIVGLKAMWYHIIMSLLDIQKKLSPLLREYGIKKASVFGSVSRGDDRPDSDVDILVSLGDQPMGMLAFVNLTRQAEKQLGRTVDIVTDKGLNKFVRPYIINDLKTIYEG